MLSLWISLIVAQLSTVSARVVRSSSAQGPSLGPHLDAPPIEDANLAVYVILLIATLAQLGLAVAFIFRAGTHRIPGFATVAALIILLLSYALGIASFVLEWSENEIGLSAVSSHTRISVSVAAGIFANWTDPFVFAAVVLLLRNRYLAYNSLKEGERTKPTLPLLIGLIVFGVLAVLLLIISIAANVLSGEYRTKIVKARGIHQIDDARQLSVTSDALFHAYTAFYCLGVIITVALAVMVKMSTKIDKIANLTLFAIVPALVLRAFARVILDIVQTQLPLSDSYTVSDFWAIDFSATLLLGGLHVVVAGMVVLFLMMPRMWARTEASQPQYGPGGIYGGPGPQQFYPQGGMQPVPQFPGQWGFPGQPQHPFQQGYPGYAPQGMNYYPNAQPQASPAIRDEKVVEGAPPQTQTPPPPTS